MAHAVRQMAYVGQVPWHGLGNPLTENADMDTWVREAGLDFTVRRSPIQFEHKLADLDPTMQTMPDQFVLHRSDDATPLGLVSSRYHIVQPAEVMDFFKSLTDIGGFQMETAGTLYDGKRIWALARVNDGAPIIGQDTVMPYLLLATSYDGQFSTTAQFTAIRVVCNNTLTWSLHMADKTAQNSYGVVRVPHSIKFDASSVRTELGIATTQWEQYSARLKRLAQIELSERQARDILDVMFKDDQKDMDEIRQTRAYRKVISLFEGAAIGSNLAEGRTGWQMTNAFTEYFDHHRGYNQSARLNNAWFGPGRTAKAKVLDLIEQVAA